MRIKEQIALWSVLFFLFFVFQGCDWFQDKPEKVKAGETVADNQNADMSIQEFVIREKMKTAVDRFPGDTLDLALYIIKNFPAGSYLADLDNISTNLGKKGAVIYLTEKGKKYVFALVVKSMEGGKLIEIDNFTGYNSSFVDYDSTNLGTAFFYLTLFSYDSTSFTQIWEEIIPQSGGLMNFTYNTWGPYKIPFVNVQFFSAPQLSNDQYNFFLVRGLENKPHLLNLYEGHIRRRRLADINRDSIPDYYEWRVFYTDSSRTFLDSVGFIWKDSVYVNTQNPKMTRRY